MITIRPAAQAALVLAVTAASAHAQGSAFTYQGRLADGGAPASGPFDFRFILYDAPVGGSQVGPIQQREDVVVADGLFSLPLDFGPAAFAGARWLDVSVRPGASTGAHTALGARQELTPAPSATFSARAPWSGISGKPPGFADDEDADTLAGLSCASGEVPKWSGASWLCAADEGTTYGAGAGLQLASNVFSLSVGGVASVNLADAAVVESKLGAAAVTSAKIANGAVVESKLGDLSVTMNKIGVGAVTTAQIAQGTITFADLGQNGCALNEVIKHNGASWGCGTDEDTTYTPGAGLNLAGTVFGIADDGVTTAKLANAAVTTAKLATGAVSSAQIADGTIALQDIGANGCLANQVMKWNGSAWACAADTDSGGDITAVNAGAGLTGGAIAGAATLAVSFGGSGAAGTVSRSDHDHGATYSPGTHDHMGQAWTGAASPALSLVTSGATGLSGRTDSTTDGSRGLFGVAAATSGSTYGVHGRSASSSGAGVFGEATHTGVNAHGVSGQTASGVGAGVVGRASMPNGLGVGVLGRTDGLFAGVRGIGGGYGVLGEGATYGILGETDGTTGAGVRGDGASIGVHGRGLSQGVFGETTGGFGGRGVYGSGGSAGTLTYGVYGATESQSGSGVFGIASHTNGNTFGVRGRSASSLGAGVLGENDSTSGAATGVLGTSDSSQGRGVAGSALASTGVNYGVYGVTNSPTGYAGYFAGNVEVTGILTRPAGELKIDHPLDPENRYLQLAAVASPDMKNVFDGVAVTDNSGYAVVELPGWFEAVNRDFRYQLTVLDEGDHPGFVQAKVVRKIARGRFTVRTSAPHAEVSWQVTGIRKDRFAERHRTVVERDKRPDERGTYLHPEAWDQPPGKGLAARRGMDVKEE